MYSYLTCSFSLPFSRFMEGCLSKASCHFLQMQTQRKDCYKHPLICHLLPCSPRQLYLLNWGGGITTYCKHQNTLLQDFRGPTLYYYSAILPPLLLSMEHRARGVQKLTCLSCLYANISWICAALTDTSSSPGGGGNQGTQFF